MDLLMEEKKVLKTSRDDQLPLKDMGQANVKLNSSLNTMVKSLVLVHIMGCQVQVLAHRLATLTGFLMVFIRPSRKCWDNTLK
jgi:hypothetical protein